MAEIKPVRALRYDNSLSDQIQSLSSPLFDVVNEQQRNKLYQNPLNSIHLSVPQGENPIEAAEQTLTTWKKEGVLQLDPIPGIYTYNQYFSLPGNDKEFCRKGFICWVRVSDKRKTILQHENTIPAAVNDRIALLEQTQLNAAPTHGLYTDELFELEPYIDASIACPIYETEDYQGVRDVLGVIHDAEVIKKFITKIQPQDIILADGHHRYEASLVYKQKMKAANPRHTGFEPYNYHLIYLTNSASDDLRILPTHRVIKELPNFDDDTFADALQEDFIIKDTEDPYNLSDIILGKPWAFGIILKNRSFKARLKPERAEEFGLSQTDAVSRLDVTVLHRYIIEKVLGIPFEEQRRSQHIEFSRSFTECLTKVTTGEAQTAIITNGISVSKVKEICNSGNVMPQKSTYFYPKAVCGFLFGSLKPHEFESFVDPGFRLSEEKGDS